jgi:hypothetical protein
MLKVNEIVVIWKDDKMNVKDEANVLHIRHERQGMSNEIWDTRNKKWLMTEVGKAIRNDGKRKWVLIDYGCKIRMRNDKWSIREEDERW